MSEALAIAGVSTQYNISYIYVSRDVTGKEAMTEVVEPQPADPAETRPLLEPGQEMLEIIAPRAQRRRCILPGDVTQPAQAQVMGEQFFESQSLLARVFPGIEQVEIGVRRRSVQKLERFGE